MMFLNPNIRSINGIKSHELLKGFFTYKLYDLYESFNRPHKLYDDIFWQLKQTFDWAKFFLDSALFVRYVAVFSRRGVAIPSR